MIMSGLSACWIFDWLFLLNSYDEKFFNKSIYPRTFAWRDRYNAAIEQAKKDAPTPTELSGDDAVTKVLGSNFQDADRELKVQADPTGFQQGEEVEMYPIDTGYNSKDKGRLVGLDAHEAVLQARSQRDPGVEVRIHHPRWNFAIKKAGGEFVTLN